MFRFEDTSAFYLLALIPVMVLIVIWMNRRLQIRILKFGKIDLVEKLKNGSVRTKLKVIFYLTAILFLVMSAVNPQWGIKKEKVKVEKSDVFFALDISASMNAEDVSPSRLEKSKKMIEQLISERKGDQLGLIFFAGGAYLQMPLTSDYAAAQLFVRSANTDMAGTQGTAIGEAIDLAMQSCREKNQRALVILSDGEDHDENAVDMAEKAAESGWSVFTIGVGSEEGSFIPVYNEDREEYKMDEEGNPVKSVLNQNLLKEIAEKGKGSYYLLRNENKELISAINVQLERMQKRAVEISSFTEYRSYYPYFLLMAIVLLTVEFFILPKMKRE